MTTASIKLTQGTASLDLLSGRYAVEDDFVPPAVKEIAQVGMGPSVNRYGGGDLVGVRGVNRDWDFGIRIDGASEAETRRALRDLQNFLARAGDTNNPLYLEYRPDAGVASKPFWGQYGAGLRYEIVYGRVVASKRYGIKPYREAILADNKIELQIKPYAIGQAQRLASATGGILEDLIGTLDGSSRGLIVPEAVQNKFNNPIFGYATWNNGWTAAASVTASECIDGDFVLFASAAHFSSAKLVSRGATNNTFTQSLNVGNTNTHVLSCYIKLPDGSAPTSSDLEIYYGSAKTTTFVSVGNGWYRAVSASFAGINAATAAGVVVKNGRTVYVVGFQLEEKAYATPLCWGDLFGCSWVSGAHGSETNRAAGRARVAIDSCIDVAQGSIRLVWKAPYANTHPNNLYLWSTGASALKAYFQASDDKFYLTDGTNTISTAAQTFAAGDIIVLHFTWSPSGGLAIYKAGASVATGGSYATPSLGSYLYIGSDDSAANQGYGPFMGCTTWRVALTASEIGNDYTGITQLVTDGDRIEAVPWLWSDDGDDTVDNCYDSTRENFVFAAGIPGSLPAITEIRGELSSAWDSSRVLWFGVIALRKVIRKPDGFLFHDQSGTSDATTCGGAYSSLTISTSESNIVAMQIGDYAQEELRGIEVLPVGRFYDAGSSLLLATGLITQGLISLFKTDYIIPTTTAAFRTHKSLALVFPDARRLDNGSIQELWLALWAKRSTGSAAFRTDWAGFLPNPMILRAPTGLSGFAKFVYRSTGEAWEMNTTTGVLGEPLSVQGRRLELTPNTHNLIMSLIGEENASNTLTTTLEYETVYITPRWSLL
jgi:hypothetical protein